MKYYFQLQVLRIHRHVQSFGLNPFFVYAVLIVLFSVFSYLLFEKTTYGIYIYFFLTISAVLGTENRDRSEFLAYNFSKKELTRIRWIENTVIVAPFTVFLVSQLLILECLLLNAIVGVLSLFHVKSNQTLVLPTPFSRWPFEFIVGFRKTFWAFILIGILTGIAIKVDNFNLGIFSLMVVYLLCMGYFLKPEPELYVWMFAETPNQFLQRKMKEASLYSLMTSALVAGILVLFFPDKAHFVLIVEVLGLLFVIAALLGKYAFFPAEINLMQGIVLGLCFLFPPLLLVVIPYFYSLSKRNLSTLLK